MTNEKRNSINNLSLTDEEEAQIQKQIASDLDAPEATDEELAQARPFKEVFPELAAKMEAERAMINDISMSEIISKLIFELDYDLSLGHIIAIGKTEIECKDGKFESFIRECLFAILNAGAVTNEKYGNTTKEIINNIIAEWYEKGGENFYDKDYPCNAPWFSWSSVSK